MGLYLGLGFGDPFKGHIKSTLRETCRNQKGPEYDFLKNIGLFLWGTLIYTPLVYPVKPQGPYLQKPFKKVRGTTA